MKLENNKLSNTVSGNKIDLYHNNQLEISQRILKRNQSLVSNDSSWQELFDWADEFGIDEDTFPRNKEELLEIKFLYLARLKITNIPETFILLEKLEGLTLNYCYELESLPDFIFNLKKLALRVWNCKKLKFSWIEKARMGSPVAQFTLGFHTFYKLSGEYRNYHSDILNFKNNESVDSKLYNYLKTHERKIFNKAIKPFTQAALKGHMHSQYHLGVMYDNGIGVPKNKEEASRWYRQAAEQDCADAQYLLGKAYDYGHGVNKDRIEAVKWYTLAAENGLTEAQNTLGEIYDIGIGGVPKNVKEAFKWFKLAAEKKHFVAQVNLAVMYSRIYNNYIETYAWFSVALANPDKNGGTLNEDVLIRIKKSMTNDQIAKAKEKADLYYEKYQAK